jgi:hypothetical protein
MYGLVDSINVAMRLSFLFLFLQASELEQALACVLDVVKNIRVLDNDLRSAVVAVERDGGHEVVYPPGFEEPFLPRRT